MESHPGGGRSKVRVLEVEVCRGVTIRQFLKKRLVFSGKTAEINLL